MSKVPPSFQLSVQLAMLFVCQKVCPVFGLSLWKERIREGRKREGEIGEGCSVPWAHVLQHILKFPFQTLTPPPLWLLNLYLSIPCLPQTLILFCHFALLSPVYKLLTYWQIFPLPIFSPNLYSHLSICSLTSFPHLSPALFVHLPSVPFSSFLHFSLFLYCPLIFSNLLPIRLLSSVQLYDMGSPADSQSSSPGCLTTDSSCVNMGFPSCGHRGRCHGEWGSFSCQCVPGYTGHQCEEGKLNFIF